jgi:hypothetical protein
MATTQAQGFHTLPTEMVKNIFDFVSTTICTLITAITFYFDTSAETLQIRAE